MEYESASKNIFLFLSELGEGAQFTGNSIVSVAYGHRLGALRLLRRLREQGQIDYKVVNRNRSIYKLTSVKTPKKELMK